MNGALDRFQMLMGMMCRTIEMEFQTDVTYPQGIRAKRFVMSKDTFQFNTSANQCYDPPDPDLPYSGIMSVAKCAEGSPMAVSFPHFLYGDKW